MATKNENSNVIPFPRKKILGAGDELDRLVGEKMFGGEVKPYSRDPDQAVRVWDQIKSNGFEAVFEEDGDLILCTLVKDAKMHATVWGLNYEVSLCRAGLKMKEVMAEDGS